MTISNKSSYFRGMRAGYRSGLEDKVAGQLKLLKVTFEYEPKDGKVAYTSPAKSHKYTPDFTFPNCHIIIETKGRFMADDRQKQLLIKAQHPDIEVRFVFSNSKQKLSKASKTTYADWCDKHGFLYADKYIPDEWLVEISQIQQMRGLN